MFTFFFSILLLVFSSIFSEELSICSCTCEEGPNQGVLSFRHREPNGIGYSTGYTSLDLFYVPCIKGNYYPYFDLRSHVFNNGKPAFNTGIGLRSLLECKEIALGGNLYWDFCKANHRSINQIGLGLEALWPHYDLSFNAYIPCSPLKKGYKSGFSGFKGNYAYFFRKYELAMWGGDLAFGYWFYKTPHFGLYAALDGYYFHGDYGKNAGGGLLRTKLNLSKYLTLEGQVSCDSLFKWIGQGELSLHIPFGKNVKRVHRCVSSCRALILQENQLVKRPDRFEIIVTTTHKKQGRALDPTTGQPLKFIFVDNTSFSQGTFESPHHALSQALEEANPGDAIYIFPGNGIALTDPVVLQDRQWLIGAGAPISMHTRFGTLSIPEQSSTLPIISVTNASAVVLANQNIISGLSLISSGVGGGCVTSSAIVSNVSILNCDLKGLGSSTGSGITADVNGQILIENNAIYANFRAINLTFSQGQAAVSIRNNQIGASSPTIGTAISAAANNSSIANVFCVDNQITFQPSSAVGMGIYINGNNQSILQTTLRGNQILSKGANQAIGIYVASNDSSQVTSDMTLNSVQVLNDSIGIAALSSSTSSQNLSLAKNQASAPSSTGSLVGGVIPTNDFSLMQQNPSTFFLQSPNGQLSGVETINTGRFTLTGILQFSSE